MIGLTGGTSLVKCNDKIRRHRTYQINLGLCLGMIRGGAAEQPLILLTVEIAAVSGYSLTALVSSVSIHTSVKADEVKTLVSGRNYS